MAGDDDPGVASPPEIVINELLASACQAIKNGKTIQEIVQSFALFYDGDTIRKARDVLEQVNLVKLPKRSHRRDFTKVEVKSKEISDMIDALFAFDWNGNSYPFAAVDLNLICHVHGGLKDEVITKFEIHRIKTRLLVLEKMCETLTSVNSKIDDLSVAFNKSVEDRQSSLKEVTVQQSAQIPKPTFAQSVIMHKSLEQIDGNRIQTSTPLDEFKPVQGPEMAQWKTVQKRRKRKSQHTVGCASSSLLQCSEVRPLHLFVTRCKQGTTADQLDNYFTEEKKWKPLKIEKLTTRFSTYESFKVTLDKAGNPIAEFLKPEHWAKNVCVRLFRETRRFNNHSENRWSGRHTVSNADKQSNDGPNVRPNDLPSPSWRS